MSPLQNDPAVLPRVHVSRLRLLQKLGLAAQGKLTMICANAGYGKTTLVADFVRSAGFRTEWYYLSPADRDITRLGEGLEAALRRLIPGPETKAAGRTPARHSGPPSTTALIEALLRQAERAGPESVFLVLDDYQNIDGSADVCSLLETFIENSPRHLRFVVLSRTVPRLPFTRLKARQEAWVLEEKELAFTLEECSRFLRIENGLDLDNAAVALVHERTEGWAAGIAMVAQSLRYGSQEKVMAVLADPVASAWLVYDYLAEEVFDRQQPHIQDFLVKTSVLSRLSGDACDLLLDTTNSQGVLLALEASGLFTTSVDPAKQTFRYHQLFLELLRQKLYQRESRESVEALHLRAAQYREREGDWEECVLHYIKAGEHLRAAKVIESIGERYIYTGISHRIEQWIKALPREVTSARPSLLTLRGRLANMSGRYEDAIGLLERALRLFRAEGDEEGQAWAIGEIAYVRFRAGQVEQCVGDYSLALSIARQGGTYRSQLLVMQGMAYREAGLLEESVKSCRASVEELANVEDEYRRAWYQSRAARNLALAQMEMGRIELARRTARDGLAFCVSNQIGEHEETWVLASLGAVLWANGSFDEAINVSDRAISLSSPYSRNLQQFVALWQGNALRDSGRTAEAERCYAQTDGAADLERCFISLLSPKSRQAGRVEAADLYRQYRDSESVVVRSTAELVFAVAMAKNHETAKAQEHAKEAVRLLKAGGYRMRLASALLHQAQIEYDLPRPSEAKESLTRALEIAQAEGLYHFFWWDAETITSLCRRALSEGPYAEYVTELALRRLDSGSAPALLPLLQDQRSEVRQRAHTILSSLPQKGTGNVRDELLSDCGDPRTRDSLLQSIAEDVISPQGVQILRSKHALSWREIEILVEYYLRPATGPVPSGARLRQECAQRLNISEYTVRCHVNNLRGKLALPNWVSGPRVLDWAAQEGLLPSPNPQPSTNPL